MRALRLLKPTQFEVIEAEIPRIASNEVLIKVHYAGICGSDIHMFHGKTARVKYPIVPGHEFAGEIAEIGDGKNNSLRVGDLVTINPLITCGKCLSCTTGRSNICPKFGLYGIDTDGGFAEYVKVATDHVVKIPAGMPADVAALAEPFSVGFHAVKRSQLQVGDKALVLGAGPIGLIVASVAKAAGAGSILVSEKNQYRLDVARKMGFQVYDDSEGDLKRKVDEITGGNGVDIVFEAAAAPITSLKMTAYLRPGGTAVMVGVHREYVPADLGAVNLRELNIIGTMVYTPNDFKAAVAMLPRMDSLPLLISHKLPLEAHDQAYSSIVNGKDAMKILFYPN